MEFLTKILEFINNYLGIIIAVGLFIDQIVKITPSEQDNNAWQFIRKLLINIYQFLSLPNRKKGGGVHRANLWSMIFNRKK